MSCSTEIAIRIITFIELYKNEFYTCIKKLVFLTFAYEKLKKLAQIMVDDQKCLESVRI